MLWIDKYMQGRQNLSQFNMQIDWINWICKHMCCHMCCHCWSNIIQWVTLNHQKLFLYLQLIQTKLYKSSFRRPKTLQSQTKAAFTASLRSELLSFITGVKLNPTPARAAAQLNTHSLETKEPLSIQTGSEVESQHMVEGNSTQSKSNNVDIVLGKARAPFGFLGILLSWICWVGGLERTQSKHWNERCKCDRKQD